MRREQWSGQLYVTVLYEDGVKKTVTMVAGDSYFSEGGLGVWTLFGAENGINILFRLLFALSSPLFRLLVVGLGVFLEFLSLGWPLEIESLSPRKRLSRSVCEA